MIRLSALTTTSLAAFVLVAAPAAAQPAASPVRMRAELAAPLAQPEQVYINGVVWACEGQTCLTGATDPRPAVACRKLARKVGAVARFTGPAAALDTAGLATCNQDQG